MTPKATWREKFVFSFLFLYNSSIFSFLYMIKRTLLNCLFVSIFSIAISVVSPSVFAADITVSALPSWATLGTDAWYHVSWDSNRYQVKSSNNGGSAGVAPDTTDSTSIFWDTISNPDLRAGNVDMNTIPKAIVGVIEWLLAVAGTLSVCALIYHAVQMQLNSGITGDASGVDKAKKWMIGALLWFVISLLSWFLVTRLADILAGMSGGA